MKKEYIISHSELRKLQSETEIEINDDISSKYYEIDFNKHEFAHKHHLQLLFGFFNGTR